MIKKFIYLIHSLSGTVTSLLFLMWFVTGLVLIYQPFPNVTKKQVNEKYETLSDSLPALSSILAQLPEGEQVQKMLVKEFQGQTLFEIKTKENTYTLTADSSVAKPLTSASLATIASRWVDAPIAKVDTLTEREQWIMYNKYEKELPIYKLYLEDEAKHELYISSQSGEVQQFTSGSERFWAYLGFIPHTLYVPPLRKHTDTWIKTISTLAIIGLIACLTGAYVGIDAYRRRYKKKGKIKTPYKKRAFKWHHILGMLFSLFLITWAISGVISLKKVPQWITKTHQKTPMGIKGKQVALNTYTFDYRELKQAYPNLKKIEWVSFQGMPIYRATIGEDEICFDASASELKEVFLSEEVIGKSIYMNHGDTITYTMKLINEYEDYYLPWKREFALPAYKVEVNDADRSLYYINPKTGDYKYVNNNRKTRKWLFNGFHYFHVKWLMDRPVLWTILIWTLALGCTAVSATGVWLSFRFVRRKGKKLIRRKDKKCRKVKS